MGGVLAAGYFLFSLIFGLVNFVLLLRAMLRFYKLSALNPICQVIYRLTNPIVEPVNRLLEKSGISISRYDYGAIFFFLLINFVQICLMNWIFLGSVLSFALIIWYTIAELIIQPCNLLFFAILIRVIISWVNPSWNHPVHHLLEVITEPLLKIWRDLIPPIAGIDFSPLVAMVILKVITLFVSGSLPFNIA